MKGKRGISLIVLVITIIIMIILAAAVILSLNSGNVVSKATEARDKIDMANAKNVVAMARAEWELMSKENKENKYENSFSSYASEKLQAAGYAEEAYEVTDNGDVYAYPVIPAGFVSSDITDNPATSVDETENLVSKGLVIYEGTEQVSTDPDAKETRNQFVWIPVDDINEFVRIDFGKGLTGTRFTNDCTEPFSKTYTGVTPNVTLSLANDLTGEYAEYNAIRVSVEKYGGFYIGRYEAGNENDTLVVKKGATVWSGIPWGTSMINVGTSGAVYKSRNMYLNTNIVKDSVVSHLIYGVEWDAALKFISSEKDVLESTSWGNYSNNPAKTGAHENWKAKNVYDMAGNIWEWSMEAYTTNRRVLRGASYYYGGVGKPAALRSLESPGVSSSYGFRVAFYIR